MTPARFDIHLICGATGAGKSTYAERLATDLGGVRFSIDEWMQALHNANKPDAPSFEWFHERVRRNCARCAAWPSSSCGSGCRRSSTAG